MDLQELSRTRLREAEALFAAGLYDGAIYLCGYVLEMALKACVCRTRDIPGYPDTEPGVRQLFKTHDVGALELLAGLRSRVAQQKDLSPEFERSWNRLILWNTDLRYKPPQANRMRKLCWKRYGPAQEAY